MAVAVPEVLAEKIARKANDLLAPLKLEMAVNKWPADLRKIMWDAVAITATAEANDETKTEDHRHVG